MLHALGDSLNEAVSRFAKTVSKSVDKSCYPISMQHLHLVRYSRTQTRAVHSSLMVTQMTCAVIFATGVASSVSCVFDDATTQLKLRPVCLATG